MLEVLLLLDILFFWRWRYRIHNQQRLVVSGPGVVHPVSQGYVIFSYTDYCLKKQINSVNLISQ